MTIKRMEHVGIVVDELAAATEFFVQLGLVLLGERSVEGCWVGRVVGLEGVRADIAIVQTPDGNGRLEGDPKDLPAPPDFNEGWRLGKPDLVISIPTQKLDATGPDQYAYIDVPTHFTEDRWVVAAELRPGNRKIVHHAHVFLKEPENKSAAAKKDPASEYAKWLMVHEGTLEWLRPEAPVIDNGCSVDDNGLLPGSKIADLGNLILPPRTRRRNVPRGHRPQNSSRRHSRFSDSLLANHGQA